MFWLQLNCQLFATMFPKFDANMKVKLEGEISMVQCIFTAPSNILTLELQLNLDLDYLKAGWSNPVYAVGSALCSLIRHM